jgi:hypothetical protein
MRSLDVADRLVRGVVAGAGTALYVGSGDWTVVRTATGVYSITFARPFRSAPVTATSIAQGSAGSASVASLTPGGIVVNTWSAGGAAVDLPFNFAATGR